VQSSQNEEFFHSRTLQMKIILISALFFAGWT
jgi:hypothetical protein